MLGITTPCVISSDDLVNHTEETLRKICTYAGIDFAADMLSWEANKKVGAWEKWSGWHGDTMASSGFQARKHAPIAYPPEVEKAIADQTPCYGRIMAWRAGRCLYDDSSTGVEGGRRLRL